MIRTTLGLLALLALLPALLARDKPDTPTPAQQYQALDKEYQTAMTDFTKVYREAKTPEERQKLIQEKYPQPVKFVPRFMKLAEKNPKDPAAVDALAWVVSHGSGVSRTKALNILLRSHIQSEKIASVCPTLGHASDKESEQFLRAVLEKSKNHPTQAQACLALGQQAENRINLAKQFKERPDLAKNYERSMGKQAVAKLVKAKPEELSKEAEVFYERVVKDFADAADEKGNKLSAVAKEKLDTLRNPIVVGKQAPEIAAEDIDGKKFKLSDYRGKVVLLDFWGNW